MLSLDRGLTEVGAGRWPWKIAGVDRAGRTRPDHKVIEIARYDPTPIRGLKPPSRDSTTRVPIALAKSDGKYGWCDVTFWDLVKLNDTVREEERNFFAIMLENHAQHFVIDLDGAADAWPQLLGKEVEIETELRALFCEFYTTQFGAKPDMSRWRADKVPPPASGAPKKTSIHINHPGVAFKMQRDLREFVLRFVRWIVTTQPDSILVNKEAALGRGHPSGAVGCLTRLEDFDRATPIDVKVYNKDRNMRLSHSCKPGKLPLIPMNPNTTLVDSLWSSLVCYSMPADPAEWLSYPEHPECVALEPSSRKRKGASMGLIESTTEVRSTSPWQDTMMDVADWAKGATFAELPAKTDQSLCDNKGGESFDEQAGFMRYLPKPQPNDVKRIVAALSHEKRLFGHHDAWRDVVWAIKAVCTNDEGYAIAEAWTKIWEDSAQRKSVLEKTWQSGRTDRFNIGSLWRWASEDMGSAAYKALWKQINPPEVMRAAKRAAGLAEARERDKKNEGATFDPLATALASNVFDMTLPENFAFMRNVFNVLSTSMSDEALCTYLLRAGLASEQVKTIRRDHRLSADWSQPQGLPEQTQREVLDLLCSCLPVEFMRNHSLVLNSDDAASTCRRDLGLAEIFKLRLQDRLIFKPSGAECYVWNEAKKVYDDITPDFLHSLIARELSIALDRTLAENEWQAEHHGECREITPGSVEDARWQARMKSIEAGKQKMDAAEKEKAEKKAPKRKRTADAEEGGLNDAVTSDPDVLAALRAQRANECFRAMWSHKLTVLRALKSKLCERTTIVCSTVIQQIKQSMRDETIDERMNVSAPWEIPIMDGLVVNCKDKTVRPRTMQDLYTDIFPVRYHRPDSSDPADVVGFEMSHKYLRGLAREGTGMTEDELESLEVDDKAEYDRVMQERDERLEVLCSRAGYTMLGEHIVKELEVFHGPTGNNGKTALSKLMDAIMGPTFCYAPETSALFSVEKDTGKQTSWKMPLRYARCALIAEPPRGLAINDTFVKIVAGGGDKQKAREVFGRQKDSRSFISPTTWWVFSNFPLRIRDDDKFSRKRANIIPALAQFAEDDVEGQRFVKDILGKYKDYVFSIFVEHAHKFYNDELTMGVALPPPGKSIVEYKIKVMSGNEPWLCFLQCCEVGKEAEITGKQFWENWEKWKKVQKVCEEITLSDKDVKERFQAHCGEPRKAASREDRANKVPNARRSLFYYGIGPLLRGWEQIAKGGLL